MTYDEILAVYTGSDGNATIALYENLLNMAPRGPIAMNLMRTCKASERAKVYRRGRYRHMAYDKKDWSIGELCRALRDADLDIVWGWGLDPKAVGFENVIYIEIPGAGQVSFHTSYRADGPDYAGQWDGIRGAAARRICRWVEAVLDGREVTNEEAKNVDTTRTEGTAAAGAASVEAKPAEGQAAFDL